MALTGFTGPALSLSSHWVRPVGSAQQTRPPSGPQVPARSCEYGWVIAECIRRGTAPAGLIKSKLDEILLVGSMVAATLYRVGFPLAPAGLPQSSDRIWTLNEEGLSLRQE